MQSGVCVPLPRREHSTSGTGGGAWVPTPQTTDSSSGDGRPQSGGNVKKWHGVNSLGAMAKTGMWPTPAARDWRDGRNQSCWGNSRPLNEVVKMWPTPNQRDYKGSPSAKHEAYSLPREVGGQLNPTWVEWLMGLPIGWTCLAPLMERNYDYWIESQRAKTSTAGIPDRRLRNMWWDNDPSETPQKWEPDGQCSLQHPDTLPKVPHPETYRDQHLGQGEETTEAVHSLQDRVSTKTQQPEDLSESRLSEPHRQNQGKSTLVPRVSKGVKSRVDRLKALGNGIVPAVVTEFLWRE